MCTWRRCRRPATMVLFFGWCRSAEQKRKGRPGKLLHAGYCDEHAKLVRKAFHVETERAAA